MRFVFKECEVKAASRQPLPVRSENLFVNAQWIHWLPANGMIGPERCS
jgi:hypothetical protein